MMLHHSRPELIYNPVTVEFVGQVAFGTVDGSVGQSRQMLRHQLRPAGYDASAEFYLYNSHYKSGADAPDRHRRQAEAAALRANLDALGEGTSAILAGDYNIRSSEEHSYVTLQAEGPGQTFDPIDKPGRWHDYPGFRAVHTQSPSVAGISPVGSGGGMSDQRVQGVH